MFRYACLTVVALGLFLTLSTTCAKTAHADPHQRPSNGSLTGKRILVSPGHGWTWQNSSNFWYTQRGVNNGIVEDFSNAMLVIDFLAPYLINAGADVVIPRERHYQTNEFIGDDGDTNHSQTGTWNNSTNVSGYWGTGYRWASTATTESAVSTWTYNVPTAGSYPVYVRFTAGSDRADDALYRVHHAGGTSEVRVAQNSYAYTNPYDSVTETVSQGGRWVFLGAWEFTPTSNAVVELSNQSATTGKVVVADAVKIGGGMGSINRGGGVSGRPRWEECSRYFAEYHGMPSSVWDSSSNDGNDNVTTPSRGLVWWGDFDLHFALHSNAGGGTGRGTVTYTYNNTSTPHPASLLADSVTLAQSVQDEVMRVNNAWAASRGDTWNDRGLNTANFGELRTNTKTPACLLEMAFHDNVDDAWYIRNPKWRHDTARAIYKSIARYFNTSATILPLAPHRLRMQNTGTGEITINWQPQTDPLEPSATPTSYRVYLSSDGVAFDNGHDANGTTSHILTGLTPGETVYAKVTALNAGGESLESEVLCARTPTTQAQGLATPALIVSGYDRLDEFTWYQQGATHTDGDMHMRNTRNWLPRHAEAIENAATTGGGSYFFDSASNECIEQGDVVLTSYALVDWVLGNESTVDETFSATEQSLVTTFVNAGGALFTSGGEIAWDLDNQGSSSDQTFFTTTFGATYASDDSNDYTVDGVGAFASVPAFSFDDGTGSSYTVGYPDVFNTSGTGTGVLEYSPGNVAGIQNGNVILFGFPFETINETNARNAIIETTLRTLIPTYTGIGSGGPGPGSGGSGGSGGGSDGDSGCAASVAPEWYSLILLLGLFGAFAVLRRRAYSSS